MDKNSTIQALDLVIEKLKGGNIDDVLTKCTMIYNEANRFESPLYAASELPLLVDGINELLHTGALLPIDVLKELQEKYIILLNDLFLDLIRIKEEQKRYMVKGGVYE